MARKYYTLVQRIDDTWCPEFGDYDRSVVVDERRDMIEGSQSVKAKDLKIIMTGDKQANIDAAVAKLNAKGDKQ